MKWYVSPPWYMNSSSWVSIDAFSIESAARKRCSKELPLRRFFSLACTIARRLPGVWWRNSMIRQGSPSKTITIPRRIWVAGMAIVLLRTSKLEKGCSRTACKYSGGGWIGQSGGWEWESLPTPTPHSHSLRRRLPAQYRLQAPPDYFSHDAMPCRSRVNPITLVERVHPRDALEQEWDEHGAVLPRQLAVHLVEARRV